MLLASFSSQNESNITSSPDCAAIPWTLSAAACRSPHDSCNTIQRRVVHDPTISEVYHTVSRCFPPIDPASYKKATPSGVAFFVSSSQRRQNIRFFNFSTNFGSQYKHQNTLQIRQSHFIRLSAPKSCKKPPVSQNKRLLWYARCDSNARPLESESNALSS